MIQDCVIIFMFRALERVKVVSDGNSLSKEMNKHGFTQWTKILDPSPQYVLFNLWIL